MLHVQYFAILLTQRSNSYQHLPFPPLGTLLVPLLVPFILCSLSLSLNTHPLPPPWSTSQAFPDPQLLAVPSHTPSQSACLGPQLVMFLAQLKAVSQAKLGLIRLGQARPKSWPEHSIGLARDPGKLKLGAQATAFGCLSHGT